MTPKQRYKFLVISFVSLLQELVVLVTLAHVRPEWRANLLFSEWADDQ